MLSGVNDGYGSLSIVTGMMTRNLEMNVKVKNGTESIQYVIYLGHISTSDSAVINVEPFPVLNIDAIRISSTFSSSPPLWVMTECVLKERNSGN